MASKRSSFYESFYAKEDEGGDDGAAAAASASYPVPNNPRRRASSRRQLRASVVSERGLASGNNPGKGGRRGTGASEASSERTNSWVYEVLNQGGSAAQVQALFGESGGDAYAAAAAETEAAGFDDEEVLEQYRIMAQHEASLRVKENTGFDIAEYEKRNKMVDENQKAKPNKMKARARLPEPAKLPVSSHTPKPEEPPMLKPKFNTVFMIQPSRQVPDLCPGSSVRSSSAPTAPDEHIVRCLGCRSLNKVKLMATLVSCSECNTVSPASSTRR